VLISALRLANLFELARRFKGSATKKYVGTFVLVATPLPAKFCPIGCCQNILSLDTF